MIRTLRFNTAQNIRFTSCISEVYLPASCRPQLPFPCASPISSSAARSRPLRRVSEDCLLGWLRNPTQVYGRLYAVLRSCVSLGELQTTADEMRCQLGFGVRLERFWTVKGSWEGTTRRVKHSSDRRVALAILLLFALWIVLLVVRDN